MAEKNLNVRISLKYDTYANWITNNPVLKAGEMALCTIPTEDTHGVSTELPAVLAKVGDGVSTYSTLPFLSAKAADVHSWAKAANKPTYSASEITGLSDYISGEIQDTDTQYKIVKVDDYNYKLQSKTLNGTWTDVEGSTIIIPNDTEAIEALEASITTLTGADTVEGSVAKALKDAKAYADGKDAAIAAAKKAGDDAQADVDALEAKVGSVPVDKTIVEMISDAQAAATYDDTALTGRVTTVEGKVTTLIGDDASKSARTIASEEVAKIVAGADASYDTLKEIADWISSHKTDATAMNSAIVALEAIVDGIGGDGEKATVVEYVTDAIAALKIGDYAKAADLTALAGRVTTLEGKAHTHANKALLDTYTQTEADLADAVAKKHTHANATVLDGISAEKITAWDAAIQSITANTGLKATKSGTDITIDFDNSVTFIFNCGDSAI